MMDLKNIELYIKFYKSPGNKQNMWIENEGLDGERYELKDIDDVNKSLLSYLKKKGLL